MFGWQSFKSIRKRLSNTKESKRNSLSCPYCSLRKAFAELPVAVMSAALIGTVILTSATGYNLYNGATKKVSQLRMARTLAADEAERVRSAGYDDIIKIEKPDGKLQNGYVKEVALGKEYREDIGNSVLKHKPVTINIYDSENSYFPLVSIKTEKVSRWYKSGTFDKSEGGIYDETGEQHSGSIKKTGSGTGYVFLKKGAKVNGEVEIYDETNGDIYIYNSIGTPGKKTVIRHLGPATASGYIRLAESCTISGTVTLENNSNGGLIIETNIPDGTYITKLGDGTGYLKLAKGSVLGTKVKVTNESAGPILITKRLMDNSHLIRTGSSNGLLTINGNIYGNVIFTMNESGNLETKGDHYEGTNINYSSKTKKALKIRGANIKGKVYFINNSNSYIEFSGNMQNETMLIASGNGTGYLTISSKILGTATIINNTSGYINLSLEEIPNKAIISKLGTGNGHLTIGKKVKLQGNLTYSCNGSGFTEFYAYYEQTTKNYRGPTISNGAYIEILGPFTNECRFAGGSQILGHMTINAEKNPNKYISFGKTENSTENYADTIIPDGLIYNIN